MRHSTVTLIRDDCADLPLLAPYLDGDDNIRLLFDCRVLDGLCDTISVTVLDGKPLPKDVAEAVLDQLWGGLAEAAEIEAATFDV